MPKPDAKAETLDIPASLRAEVKARDGENRCRGCGRVVENISVHHVNFGAGMGARRRHDLDNLIQLCFLYPIAPGVEACHERAHGRKDYWIPILQQVIATPGMTALQLDRWARGRRRYQ